MRRFRRLFVTLFIAATLLGALHEIIHNHHHDVDGHYEQSCPLYLLTQTPAIAADVITLETIPLVYEPFRANEISIVFLPDIPSRNRSPPLA